MLLSGAAGLVCWGLMLVLVMALSRRAIRPIVENMEKQKQFVTNAGHEIKTPLAIIQSNTEAMELYNGETKWSRNIKDQTVRLSGLMADLLALARMDEGAAPAQKAALSFSGWRNRPWSPSCSPWRPRASPWSGTFSRRCPPPPTRPSWSSCSPCCWTTP